MPTHLYPTTSGFDDDGVIHVQGGHGRSPCWCEANDAAAILAPTEVSVPWLPAWMEQSCELIGQRILGLQLCSLVFVTGMSGHTEAIPHCLTASCFRDDVVDHQPCACDSRQGVTIGALMAGLG
jgi:hypothetical protein